MMDWHAPQLLVAFSFALRAVVPIVVRSIVGLPGLAAQREKRAAKLLARPVTNAWFVGDWLGNRIGDAVSIGVLVWGGFF